jgi:hypothetical protein
LGKKVFWFFFSKKNCFLAAPVKRPRISIWAVDVFAGNHAVSSVNYANNAMLVDGEWARHGFKSRSLVDAGIGAGYRLSKKVS